MNPERTLRPNDHDPDEVLPERVTADDAEGRPDEQDVDAISTAEDADEIRDVEADDGDDAPSGPRTVPRPAGRVDPDSR